MARKFLKRDSAPILAAAEQWIKTCLIKDEPLFSPEPRKREEPEHVAKLQAVYHKSRELIL